MLKLLLFYCLIQRINPNASGNDAIRSAFEYQKYDVVKILLLDPRTDRKFDDNWLLRRAKNLNLTDIIEILEEDTTIHEIVELMKKKKIVKLDISNGIEVTTKL